MAYNNYFPTGYQPYYQNNAYQMQQNVPQQQMQSGIIWVQGEAGAKSYLVAPNNTVQLWDSENNVIYLKSADSSGMPSIKVLDYTIRENGSQMAQNGLRSNVEYATKEELEKLKADIMSLIKKDDKKGSINDGELPF